MELLQYDFRMLCSFSSLDRLCYPLGAHSGLDIAVIVNVLVCHVLRMITVVSEISPK